MRKTSVSLAVLGIAAATVLSACGSDSGSGSSNSNPPANSGGATQSSSGGDTGGKVDGQGKKVGIILPDTTSSPRWITADPTALEANCKTYNLDCNIKNADGSASKMKTIAQQMISDGVKVLMIVNLDSASGAAIQKQATAAGVITVDYDRLTLGGTASLYISFDNVKVGEAQGKALTECPQVANAKAVQYVDIDGAPTDNNATLFAQGYDSVLSKQPGWTRVAKQTGQWDAPTASRVFNSMLSKNPNIKAVMVANDTMAGAVITNLKRQSLNGKVAVSGQDASAAGLQQILAGNQCFTIYKPSTKEAQPAIEAIAQLANGKVPDTKGVTIEDTQSKKKVPAILATPTVITKSNVADPINDKYTPKNTVCTGSYASLCTKAGVK